jgi:hypothetical protein
MARGGQQGGVHGGSISGLAELSEDARLLGHEAYSGQHVQVQPVVLACCLTGKCYPVNEPGRRFVASP